MSSTDDSTTHGEALELMDRLAEMGEAHFEARRMKQAQFFLMRGVFVGVRQLVTMAGEAKAFSAEERARNSDANLTTVKLLADTLDALGMVEDEDDVDGDDAIPNA